LVDLPYDVCVVKIAATRNATMTTTELCEARTVVRADGES